MNKLIFISFVCSVAFGGLVVITKAEAAPYHDKHHGKAVGHKSKAQVFHRIGHRIHILPNKHKSMTVRGIKYFYHAGVFYQRASAGFVVVTSPVGAHINALGRGFISFQVGARRYFHVNATYYIRDKKTKEYIVIDKPKGAPGQLVAANKPTSGKIFIYPRENQKKAKQGQDRYECHLWAVEKSGLDPSHSEYLTEDKGDYHRAITACLEGRGYTVR